MNDVVTRLVDDFVHINTHIMRLTKEKEARVRSCREKWFDEMSVLVNCIEETLSTSQRTKGHADRNRAYEELLTEVALIFRHNYQHLNSIFVVEDLEPRNMQLELEKCMMELKEILEDAGSRNQVLEAKVSKLERDYQTLQQEHRRMAAEKNAVEERSAKELVNLRQSERELLVSRERLESEIDELEKENRVLVQRTDDYLKELGDLRYKRDEVINLKAALDKSERMTEFLQRDLSKVEINFAKLVDENMELNQRHEECLEEISACRNIYEDLTGSVTQVKLGITKRWRN